ncbi:MULTISPECIES: hypothetical protein [Komagataeibacter]|uniref:XRE family transcriptional regulator n=1 Tax=Komagataeibacter xylinus TaxID=28448 RepID=A0A857FNZ8_KOMXY|nr:MULTISPECIES: hypothetical protein [Komagataeibacter]QHC36031.1 hypothetical protein FMA36_11485 [Komagataeibacter xylinus]GCE89837.1 hypothetical protein MSKU15_1438 [Komagataeibacter diospyri]
MAAQKRPIRHLSPAELADIRLRLSAGEHQHLIAADYKINQGRLSEFKNGKRTTIRDGRV